MNGRPKVLTLAALMLAGCGASHQMASTRTDTISAAKATREINRAVRACSVLTARAASVCKRDTAPGGPVEVVSCGNRIYTEGACEYARQVIIALDDAFRVPPTHAVRVLARFAGGASNPSRCSPSGAPGATWATHGTWVCRSLKSGVTATWRAAK